MAWTIGNKYLTEAQMQGNAIEVHRYFAKMGWSLNAIGGILGNMEKESNINPGLWQSLQEGNYKGGFGLVQWTPATNYTSWATANGYSINNPDGQLYWIQNLTVSSGQWIKTSAYPISFEQFRTSKESPEYLASAFLKNFERAGVEVEAERRQCARKWYNYLEQFSGADVIEKAIKWACDTAADDSHGYSQQNRWGPDYDCSSFVTQAYRKAGVNIGGGTGVYTGNMKQYFTAAGFTVADDVNLVNGDGAQRGDVFLNTTHHTAMYLGNGRIVHASSSRGHPETGDQTGTEVYEANFYSYPWDLVLRYKGQLYWIQNLTVSSGQWIKTSAYPISFEQFRTSKESPEYLASAFLKNFERAGVEVEAERRQCARKWYNYLEQFSGADVIEKAIKWACDTAADDSHGYSQQNRWGPDYDCSSFVTQAYRKAGVNIGGGTGVYTGNMKQYFTAAGFTVADDVNLVNGDGAQRGDVFLNTTHHTAMYLGNGRIVHASSSRGHPETGDQTGTEVYEANFYSYPWDLVLRYKGGGGIIPPEPEGLYIVRFIPA